MAKANSIVVVLIVIVVHWPAISLMIVLVIVIHIVSVWWGFNVVIPVGRWKYKTQ